MGQGILLIEDEEILAGNIKRYLDRRGYEVVTAGTAAEGLRLFEQGEIDLVLLDLNLPDLHGLKVLEEIRRRDPRVKVVCVTGNGSCGGPPNGEPGLSSPEHCHSESNLGGGLEAQESSGGG
jgi:DNA-binding NtrC family response regulator